jgi:hypothetical protein
LGNLDFDRIGRINTPSYAVHYYLNPLPSTAILPIEVRCKKKI